MTTIHQSWSLPNLDSGCDPVGNLTSGDVGCHRVAEVGDLAGIASDRRHRDRVLVTPGGDTNGGFSPGFGNTTWYTRITY